MRLPLIAPDQLTAEQKPLYADMKKGIGSNFNVFLTVAPEGTTEAGALMGPWNPWLHEPRIGGAIWDLTKTMTMEATLPDTVRQIAILVTGAHFKLVLGVTEAAARWSNKTRCVVHAAHRNRNRA